MAGRSGALDLFRPRRPRPRTRMYEYNFQYGMSYYKPQVNYIGGMTTDTRYRRSRRRTVSPPGAKTFSERWASDPFYGVYQPWAEWDSLSASGGRGRSMSQMPRASSIPADLSTYGEEAIYRGRSASRAKSMVREQSVLREGSAVTTRRARSMTRARSVSRARSVFEGDYDDVRSVRGRSATYYDNYSFDPLSDEEWERVLKLASKEEREKSIFQLRMSLENPRDLPKKKMMKTTVGHGFYQNSLYGTETWDPSPFVGGRQ